MNSYLPISIAKRKELSNYGFQMVRYRNEIQKQIMDESQCVLVANRITLVVCLACIKDHIKSDKLSEMTLESLINHLKLQVVTDDNWLSDYCIVETCEQCRIQINNAYLEHLMAFFQRENYLGELPYVMELLMYDGFDLTKEAKSIDLQKKKNGIYFTPYDVADYMADICIDAFEKQEIAFMKESCIDFSCGTGVLLCRILTRLWDRKAFVSEQSMIDFACNHLYGIDINPMAIDIAAFLLFIHLYDLIEEQYNTKSWDDIQRHFWVKDALECKPEQFSSKNWPHRFGCIIGNPPYAETKELDESGMSIGNMYIPFVKNGFEFACDKSIMCLILPLSICYNTKAPYKELRNKIEQDTAEWSFLSFDRSPDALFGDDVKTRNAIVIRNSFLEKRIKTTTLMRWASINRNVLFTEISCQDICGLEISTYIPKLGTKIEYDAFKLLKSKKSIGTAIGANGLEKAWIGSTVYNSINAFDHQPEVRSVNGSKETSTNLRRISFENEDDKYYFLCCMCSTIAYWLWIVIGDGFHFSINMIGEMGLHKDNIKSEDYKRLVELGKKYCAEIRKYPTQSHNAGKIITNYDRTRVRGIVSEIDRQLVDSFHLPKGFDFFLNSWYDKLIDCGRSENNAKAEGYNV